MILNFLKTLFTLSILLSFSSCNKIKPNTFILNGNIEGNYSGYIYLNYNAIKDSCLVTNNSFRFEGEITSATSAMIGTQGRTSAMEKDFFIEEGELFITIEPDSADFKSVPTKQTKIRLLHKSYFFYYNSYNCKLANDK